MNVTTFFLFDGEYFKHMHRFDHFTIVVEGVVRPEDAMEFKVKLQRWFREHRYDRNARVDNAAEKILVEFGYAPVKTIIEDIDFTGYDVS